MHMLTFFREIKRLNFTDILEVGNLMITPTSDNCETFSVDILEGEKIVKTIYANKQELLTRTYLIETLNLKIKLNTIIFEVEANKVYKYRLELRKFGLMYKQSEAFTEDFQVFVSTMRSLNVIKTEITETANNQEFFDYNIKDKLVLWDSKKGKFLSIPRYNNKNKSLMENLNLLCWDCLRANMQHILGIDRKYTFVLLNGQCFGTVLSNCNKLDSRKEVK